MGLKGSLRDFGISEILQLIGLQRRSGILEVRSERLRYKIFFDSGKIVLVEKEPEELGERLEDYLIRARILGADHIRYALNKARSELKMFEQVLVNLGLVKPENLRQLQAIRAQDLLHQLFLLKEGEYEFESQTVNYHPELCALLDTEQILMDGYRVKDEWSRVIRAVGGFDAVFKKKPGEFGLSDRLGADEEQVYRLVDGRRTIAELAVLTRKTRFDTAKIIADLIQKERVEPAVIPKKPLKEEKKRDALFAQLVFWALAIVFLGLLAVGAWGYLKREKPKADFSEWLGEYRGTSEEIFYLEKGYYPQSSDELYKQGIISNKSLHFLQNVQ